MIDCLCFLCFFSFFKSYSKKVDFIKKWLVKYSHYAINITLLPTQNCFQRQTENKRYILLRINPSICRTLFFIIIASFQGLSSLFYNLQEIPVVQRLGLHRGMSLIPGREPRYYGQCGTDKKNKRKLSVLVVSNITER